MTAMVDPARISAVMGLRSKVRTVRALSKRVAQGLPKSALRTSLAKVFDEGAEQTAMLYRIVPEATYKRRRERLKADESERIERVARVIATALYVWDDEGQARRFLTSVHSQLASRRPIDVALTELGARQVEALLWKLYYGIAA